MDRAWKGRGFLGAVTVAVLIAAATGTSDAAADDANANANANANAKNAREACAASDVEYVTVGNLLVRDTQFGAADGVYPLGTGTLRVRFEQRAAGSEAKLMSYVLDNHLVVRARFAFWSTQVETQSRTVAADTCGGASRGELTGDELVWRTPVAGYRSDGTLVCEGNVCGNFGAPPPGSSALHEVDAVMFKPFHFSRDGKTFSMPYTVVSHSDSPQQTNYLSLSGRETRRTCVVRPAACSSPRP